MKLRKTMTFEPLGDDFCSFLNSYEINPSLSDDITGGSWRGQKKTPVFVTICSSSGFFYSPPVSSVPYQRNLSLFHVLDRLGLSLSAAEVID